MSSEFDLQNENAELRMRLQELEETLDAIRNGEVDALVVSGEGGDQIYTLHGADQPYRVLMENMSEGAATVAEDGLILFCNSSFASMLKVPLDQMIGTSLFKWISPDYLLKMNELFAEAKGCSARGEMYFHAYDDQGVPTQVSLNGLGLDGVRVVSVLATDLTIRKRQENALQEAHDKLEMRVAERTADLSKANLALEAEIEIRKQTESLLQRQNEDMASINEELAAVSEELRTQNDELSFLHLELQEEKARYLDLFDSAPDGYLVTDQNGKILKANESATLMLGCSLQHLVGGYISAFASDEYKEGMRAVRDGIMPVPNWEVELQPWNGGRFWGSLSVSAIHDNSGKTIGVRWLIRDITELKKAQQTIAQTVAELKRSNQDLEQFAYVASHDLKEPLRMILGFLSILRRRYEGKLDAEANEFITFAIDGAGRMEKLISDLLDFSRTGKQRRPGKTIGIDSIVDEAIANLNAAIDETAAIVTHDPLPEITGDKSQLLQLFQNLIANGIKFKSANPPRIHINSDARDGEIVISISDNGIGVPEDKKDLIFDAFRRLHTYEKYPGSGIGLSICRRIMENHGGRIWVESQPGAGSTFLIAFPKRA